MTDPRWWELTPEQREQAIIDAIDWDAVTSEVDYRLIARALWRAINPRLPGTPAVPCSYGPACGITKLRVTARTTDGTPVL